MTDAKDPSTSADLTRRGFSALTLAAGVAGASGAMAAPTVVETAVSYRTPDGTVDAALFHPAGKGKWPGIVYFSDAFGLRPASRDMARRMAAEGYVLLVPNPYYRDHAAPGPEIDMKLGTPEGRALFGKLRGPLTPAAVASDSIAHLKFLDAQAVTNTKAKAGVTGYCMGGPMVMQAAAASPGRIGGLMSCHGGGLVTDGPDSPHLLVPKILATCSFAVADNDDQKQPEAKTVLAAAFDKVGRPAKVEVYKGAMHGWTMPDGAVYNHDAAEKAWAETIAVFKRSLV